MSKQAPKSWRDVLPVHPAVEMFPLMSPDELKDLGADIKQKGLSQPVSLWRTETGYSLLDGRNRLDAMEMVGIKVVLDANEELVGKKIRTVCPGNVHHAALRSIRLGGLAKHSPSQSHAREEARPDREVRRLDEIRSRDR